MKYGITYSYWGKDWEGSDYPQKIERARKCGLDILEIFYGRILTMSDQEIAEINAAQKDNGIEVYALGGFGAKQDLSSLDETVRRGAVEEAKALLKAISRLNIHNFSGINYGQWCGLSDPGNKARRFEQAARSLGEVGRFAADYDTFYLILMRKRVWQVSLSAPQSPELLRSILINTQRSVFRSTSYSVMRRN